MTLNDIQECDWPKPQSFMVYVGKEGGALYVEFVARITECSVTEACKRVGWSLLDYYSVRNFKLL